MAMKWFSIVLAAALAGGLGVILGLSGSDSPLESTAARTIPLREAPAGAEAALAGRDAGPRGAVGPLDCGRGDAVVARVDGAVIEARVLCAALDAVAGGDGAARRAQGPAVLERLIEARLAEGAAPAPVDEAAIERELALRPEAWAAPGRATIEGVLVRVADGGDGAAARARVARFIARGGDGALARAAGLEVVGPSELGSDAPEVALAAAVFEPGLGDRWTAPVRTRAGWVAVRAREVVAPRARSLAEASDEVRRELEARALTEARERVLRLRGAATIERFVVW